MKKKNLTSTKSTSFLTKAEQNKILIDWNKTETPFPKDKTITELFESQVKKTPNNIAVTFEQQKLTYKELNQKANQIAHKLRTLNKQKSLADQLIGLCVERSPEMIIGILGILKAGGAYVPLDPEYPADRLQFILKDTKIKLILTQVHLQKRLALLRAKNRTVLCLDKDWPRLEKLSKYNLSLINKSTDLMYVIYTSGSTGTPKGAMLEHCGIVNRLLWMKKVYKITSRDRILQKTPYSFDVSVWELILPLLSGARLCFAKPGGHRDPLYLYTIINKYKITTMHFVPSMLITFLNFLESKDPSKLKSLRRIFCSGEGLATELAQHCLKTIPAELHNLYGPTEASIDVSFWDCSSKRYLDKPITPIGKPIDNIKLYILNKLLQPVPIGVPGELYIAGIGLARGYLNRPELNKERFITNPFITGSRLYKTGDLVRWLPDGNIEFIGRADFQVKIRGFRIELGEIEAILAQQPDIKQCVVLVYEKNGDKHLVAYYVPKQKQPITTFLLKDSLRKKLPDYMIPAFFVYLTEFPLTPSGKIDRKNLPAPQMVSEEIYIAPRDEEEKALAGIWSQVLKLEQIGINDKFFDLGGNSLTAAQVIARINQAFNIDCSITAIFEYPTIDTLTTYIKEQLLTTTIGKQQIKKVRRTHNMLLSFAEQRLWFLDHYEESARATYNTPFAIKLVGSLNIAILEQSFNYLIARHEAFRTKFKFIAGQPRKEILPEYKIKLRVETVSEKNLAKNLTEEAHQPFALTKVPLLRVRLFKLETNKYILAINLHHIINDGWSAGILINELSIIYTAFINKELPILPKLPIQYVDFAYWQRDWLKGTMLKKQLNYWSEKLKDFSDLELPTDFPRPPVKTYNGSHYQFILDERLTRELKNLSRATNTTLFMVLLAAFNVLLSRYSGQEDIIVGSPIANRNNTVLENIIGFFVNTIALRANLAKNLCFTDFLAQVKQTCLEAYAHQDLPFEYLVESLQIPRDVSRTPIFQVMFILQNPVEQADLVMPKLTTEHTPIAYNIAKFDLLVELIEKNSQLTCTIEYNTNLYKLDTIKRVAKHYLQLLNSIIARPNQAIFYLPLLSDTEKNNILVNWNNTTRPFPQDQSIQQLFEEQVEKTPTAIAVIFAEQQLTYHELNAKANQLAHTLRNLDKSLRDKLIGLCIERSLEMIIAILGILKAGAAYVPLDPNYPRERLEFILQDTKVEILLMDKYASETLPFLAKHAKTNLILDEYWNKIAKASTKNPTIVNQAGDLAYVIYTSGSTGIPKGVILSHTTITNLITWQASANSNVTQFASFVFDVSLQEIFYALLNGHQLHVISSAMRASVPDFVNYVESRKISKVFMPTSLLEYFANESLLTKRIFPYLEEIIVAGEALIITPNIKKFYKEHPQIKLSNHYGPSETHVVTAYTLPSAINKWPKLPPIGKPIANTTLYVLNKYLLPVPIGVTGELYIGGVGLARGYLNQPKLTKEKFIDNPLKKGERLYKTGDLVRWLPSGNLEFVSRIDNQVKIRGFRIELGEIEITLSHHTGIRQCAVVAREIEGQKHLIAYYILKTKAAAITPDMLRKFLAKKLPEYMLPTFFVHLEKFPLTATGKINHQALPTPSLVIAEGYLAPSNAEEQALAEIWSQLFKIERIGINDNFFSLGGNSLNATQITSQINQLFAIDCPIRAIFEYPTIAKLALYIKEQLLTSKITKQQINRIKRNAAMLLSFAQQRLWFLDRYEESTRATYNIPIAIKLTGDLNIAILERSLNYLIARHESLRTKFKYVAEQPCQEIVPEFKLKLQAEKIRKQELADILVAEAHKTFALHKLPLLRVRLLKLAAKIHVLMINQHHIISDGWSIEVLLNELSKTYNAFIIAEEPNLPDLSIQYVDFAYWQRDWLKGSILQKQLKYWREKLQGFSELELSGDFPRPAVKTYNGRHYHFTLDADLSNKLKQLSIKTNTTLYMLLLAAFKVLLSRYSGQQDIIVGSPIANRNNIALENIIGFFVNTLALRTNLAANPSFIDLLAAVKQTCLEAYAHQDLPFERLVEELHIPRDISRTPLFQIFFMLQNVNEKSYLQLSNIVSKELEIEYKIAKFDLSLYIFSTKSQLKCIFEFNTDLYKATTINRLAKHFIVLLNSIIKTPQEAIQQLPILSGAEKKQLLITWNRKKDFPVTKTIHELFTKQVRKTPNNIALIYEDQELSYKQLHYKTNQLANYLRSFYKRKYNKTSLRDELIAICIDRSLEMIIGILGILKAGGAYVPLDPEYPRERIKFILADINTKLILTKQQLANHLSLAKNKILCLDTNWPDIAKASKNSPRVLYKPNDLAYIIYTSGTTGQPKGVLISHGNVIRLFATTNSKFHFTEHDVWTLFHSYAFDFSVWEIWGALLYGGRLVIIPYLISRDPERFNHLLYEKAVTILNQTPLAFYQLINVEQNVSQKHKTLRYIIFGGQALNIEALRPWWNKYGDYKPKLINMYGITETTVHATHYALNRQDLIKNKAKSIIGRKLADLIFYVFDKYMQLVPVGVSGELYIGGAGLAQGYLNRPELTQEKFIKNPFLGEKTKNEKKAQEKNTRLYKTGDLVRWLPDGNLEFIGRSDDQVKIRGFRIELGEVENILIRYKGIEQCVVVVHEVDEQKHLVAYYIAAKKIDSDTLHKYLAKKLPDYMIPKFLLQLKKFPLTSSGKTDRLALSKLETEKFIIHAKFVKPRDPLEIQLYEIWQAVLKIKKISIYDNFFDLGGNSLMAVQLISKINQAFSSNYAVAWVFINNSIAKQAIEIRKKDIYVTYKPILSFNPAGKNLPLIFVHPGTAGAEAYLEFASLLDKQQPFYAIESYNLYSGLPYLTDIPSLAAQYIKYLKAILPNGPYYLGGWSLGGIIAYEMAQQLTQQKDRVAEVYLIDSYLLSRKKAQAKRFIKLMQNMLKQELTKEFYTKLASEYKHRIEELSNLEIASMINYIAKPYTGKVTLFKAEKLPPVNAKNAAYQKFLTELKQQDNGWRSLIKRLTVKTIAADHKSIMQHKNLRLIIKMIMEI